MRRNYSYLYRRYQFYSIARKIITCLKAERLEQRQVFLGRQPQLGSARQELYTGMSCIIRYRKLDLAQAGNSRNPLTSRNLSQKNAIWLTQKALKKGIHVYNPPPPPLPPPDTQ